MAVAAVALTALSSCTDDYSYTPETEDGNAKVYFSNQLVSVYDVPAEKTTLSIPLSRNGKDGELTVPVTVTSVKNYFTAAKTEVTFKSGEQKADVVLNYDPKTMPVGQNDTVTVKIDPNYASNFGDASYTFVAGMSGYEDMADSCVYTDDCLAALLGVPNAKYKVRIQKNTVNEGWYRLVNAYGEAYPYNDPSNYDASKDYYMEIDASDPDFVYVVGGEQGCEYGAGMTTILSYVQYYMMNGYSLDVVKAKKPELFGKLKDGVITMPASSMIVQMPQLGTKLVGTGMFRIQLPPEK